MSESVEVILQRLSEQALCTMLGVDAEGLAKLKREVIERRERDAMMEWWQQ